MTIQNDIQSQTKKILAEKWSVRDGRIVPSPNDLGLGNDAVKLEDAVVLYADINGSTKMVDEKIWQFSAKVYKVYLDAAARLIKSYSGVITAYDGDRIMGIFIGENRNTRAVRTALNLNWAVNKVINPAIKDVYNTDFGLRHIIGIDRSDLYAARTGVRGDNDIVWVGRAANHAAKLTSFAGKSIWISEAVFNNCAETYKSYNSQNVWTRENWTPMGNRLIYGSNWTWVP